MSSPSSAVLTDRSTLLKTPTNNRCGPSNGGVLGGGTASISVNSTPITTPPCTPRRRTELRTPRSAGARRTPGGDRFIPSRAGADLQYSAYKVRSARRYRHRDSGGATAEENGGLARTPLAADPHSARRRERLFALRGRSSASRVLNIKQAPASGNSSGETSLE